MKHLLIWLTRCLSWIQDKESMLKKYWIIHFSKKNQLPTNLHNYLYQKKIIMSLSLKIKRKIKVMSNKNLPLLRTSIIPQILWLTITGLQKWKLSTKGNFKTYFNLLRYLLKSKRFYNKHRANLISNIQSLIIMETDNICHLMKLIITLNS